MTHIRVVSDDCCDTLGQVLRDAGVQNGNVAGGYNPRTVFYKDFGELDRAIYEQDGWPVYLTHGDQQPVVLETFNGWPLTVESARTHGMEVEVLCWLNGEHCCYNLEELRSVLFDEPLGMLQPMLHFRGSVPHRLVGFLKHQHR